jgi:dolichol-phosphate mannosyltransferase
MTLTDSTSKNPDTAPVQSPELSIVVPTRNEAANIAELFRRLDFVLADMVVEVIVVDDSDDETPELISGLALKTTMQIRLVTRSGSARAGGLATAVMTGMRTASAPWVVVMDADLQHPPEAIPSVLQLAAPGVDAVVATRYSGVGDAKGLAGPLRRGVSTGACAVSKFLFPGALRNCSDPMSGFYAVRRHAVDLNMLRPTGFKILLETLVRSTRLNVAEVEFTFAPRFSGDSKASTRQGLTFLRHLLRLRLETGAGRAVGFGLVGLTGILPNLLATAVLVHSGLSYVVAATGATQVAITYNFVLVDRLLFSARRRGSWLSRYARFAAINNTDLVARLPLLYFLVSYVGVHYLLANAATLLVAFGLRFILTDRFVYSKSTAPADELLLAGGHA